MANMVGYREDSDFVKASETVTMPHCQTLIAPELKRDQGRMAQRGAKIDAKRSN